MESRSGVGLVGETRFSQHDLADLEHVGKIGPWKSPSAPQDAGEMDEPPSAAAPTTPPLSRLHTRQKADEQPPDNAPASVVGIKQRLGGDLDSRGSEADALTETHHDQEMHQESVEPVVRTTNSEAAVVSFASSLSALTEFSEVSSVPSIVSSKATTPVDPETVKTQVKSEPAGRLSGDQPSHRPAPPFFNEGIEFAIPSKSSIPTDISSRDYASQCIEAAESSRLNPFALHSEEYLLLRHHISHAQVTTYLNIRNGILRLWLKQPWTCVSRQDAVGCASARWFDAASVCYDWLVRRGYINFGCLQLPDAFSSGHKPPLPQGSRRKTVVIVGAGISGLSCARQLEGLFAQFTDRFRQMGEDTPKVLLLEGRSRIGGRVYSRELRTRPSAEVPDFAAKRHTAEMGGMIITGFDRGNPMNVLVRGQLGLPYQALTAETTIYDSNGKPVDPVRDQLVEKLYNDCLERASEFKFRAQPPKLVEGHRALLESGRDSPSDGGKSIMQVESAAVIHSNPASLTHQHAAIKADPDFASSGNLVGPVRSQHGHSASLQAREKAKAMGWSLRPDTEMDDSFDLGDAADRQNATLGSVLDCAISQYGRLLELDAQDYRLLNWHIANLEYSNATNLHNLSLPLWDLDAGNEWEGKHTMIVGGYQGVARGLLQFPTKLNLMTDFPVRGINYQSNNIQGPATVHSDNDQTVEADCVVCTVPLGVLKYGSVAFEPPLPPWKGEVIERLGFGILNKVVLVYEKMFWESERHIFGILQDSPEGGSRSQKDYRTNRGRFFQWFNVTNMAGLPCLVALMAGDAGFETERRSNEHLIAEATRLLRSVFGSDVPYPLESIVTRWGSDPFSRGSYSSAAPGIHPDDYDTMARPVGNLFFAGEHTIGTHPATVHGAYLSGLRAASEVLEVMIGPIEVPTPLILPRDSLLLHKRSEAARNPRQARLEAYELEIWQHIRSQIGERPMRPKKAAGNAYIIYSKARFEEAKRRCEGKRKPGRSRSMPNEVRVMTSKMWKEASAEERKPFEEQAAEEKKAFAEAMTLFNDSCREWDQKAAALRSAYEAEHPSVPSPQEEAEEARAALKHRRVKHAASSGDQSSKMG